MTDFAASQFAKWERFREAMPGLQYSVTASGRHMIRVSNEGLEDTLLIGRAGYQRVMEPGPGPMLRSQRVAKLIDVPPIDLTDEAYERFAAAVDVEMAKMVYTDPRNRSYYRNKYGRSSVNNVFHVRLLWNWMRDPARRDEKIAAGG